MLRFSCRLASRGKGWLDSGKSLVRELSDVMLQLFVVVAQKEPKVSLGEP